VLVVEDEADIAVFLRAYFKAAGLVEVEHLVPSTADEVVQGVRATGAGCVLLDLHLGHGLTGFEILEAMTAAGLLPGLPVLVVTADTADATASQCRQLGAVDVYAKPFDVRDLYADVADLLGVAGQ
jgi:DNA-binding response OmpR family regulator